MLNPNLVAQLYVAQGFTKFGQRNYAASPVDAPCAVIKLAPTVKKSAIRTTETASRSSADEELDPAVLLFPPSVTIHQGDKVVLFGNTLICKGVSPQITLDGLIDFYQCEFEAG